MSKGARSPKSRSAPRGSRVAVRTARVARSGADVESLQHSIDFHDSAFADAKIGATHVDHPTAMVIIHMETLTDEAAARLVQLYGTEQVAVLLEHFEPAWPGGSLQTLER